METIGSSRGVTLETLIDAYGSEVENLRPGQAAELEVRFGSVDYEVFETALVGLLEKKIPVGDPELVQTVESVSRGGRKDEKLIRTIAFRGGKPESQIYSAKTRIGPPFRTTAGTMPHSVVLSVESPTPRFIIDSDCLVRLKTRLRFLYATRWSVDLTIARQVSGNQAKFVSNAIRDLMVNPGDYPAAEVLGVLGLSQPAGVAETRTKTSARRSLFQYEIEIELVNAGPASLTAADVEEVVAAVSGIFSKDYANEVAYREELYYAAKYVVSDPALLRQFRHDKGLRALTPQPISLTRFSYGEIFPPLSYFITDKADGERALASLHDGKCVVILSGVIHEFPTSIPAGSAPARATILDGEAVVRRAEPSADPEISFYAFDIVILNGENVSRLEFRDRVGMIGTGVDAFASAGASVPGQRLQITPKKFFHLEDREMLEAQFEAVRRAEYPYKTDGLILTEPGKSYRNTQSYKWKDARDATIDFLLRRCPPSVLGKYPFVAKPKHEVYLLFVGINLSMMNRLGIVPCPGYEELFGSLQGGRGDQQAADNYVPIQFATSDNPYSYIYQHPMGSFRDRPDALHLADLDSKVVEMRCSRMPAPPEPPEWEIVRLREDKQRDGGQANYNNIQTAESVWMTLVDPFPFAELYAPTKSYFLEVKSAAHKAHTAVTSTLKSEKIRSIAHAGWVVDLGAGKGQDLKRYMDAQVQNLIAVDQDRTALTELIRRKYASARSRRETARNPTSVRVVVSDLLADGPGDVLAKARAVGLPASGADAAVSNLSVSYLAGSTKALENFGSICQALVKVGGKLIVTTFSGAEVIGHLKGLRVGEKWDLYDGDVVKFSVQKMFQSDALQAAGQKIRTMLPFSRGHYYEEYLVNIDELVKVLADRQFVLNETTMVRDFVPEFQVRNPEMAASLTESDRTWLSMQVQLTFTRAEKTTRRIRKRA